MTLNNVKVLLMGDASTRVEADLLASYNLTDGVNMIEGINKTYEQI